ncbi:MAG: thiol oxidoreductase [candidate division KSB1 bacterium]|nr:thiol oxidoreductase [candidate division KSB1 bacterium]MDZ7274705.1 thiol oxidoreductase [candidate division KSB1 bacterium]MDZ7285530.1 thiol oxidoreductase [candidate division KSB1 bacterium]MDZ7298562.1 thiol oxidoreductase [candidate division KSB1 bacterium]MDZ7306586.1 thiol oxidoreductase [candidate division KSB1 bacterium]
MTLTVRGLLLLLLPWFAACGPLLTEAPPPDQVLDATVENLSPAQLAAHLAGDEAFGEAFTPATGLGPIFNQTSCESCHPAEGRGHPSTNLTRFGRATAGGFDYLPERGGPQLQDRALPGYPAEKLPAEATAISERGGPLVVGLGLIEAIPDETILAREDPNDAEGDGISGRANFVLPPPYLVLDPAKVSRDGKYLGRFGRKATAINLLQQTVTAYRNDIGVTSEFEAEELFNPVLGNRVGDNVPDPEVSTEVINQVVFYLQTLRPPLRRHREEAVVRTGERLFDAIGCTGCHVPEMQTGPSAIAALAFQRVPLYSDLLLHDMGPALADNYPEGEATGSEWRTTPLWGLGLVGELLGGTPFYLHDGRTASLEAAILLHGGEAQKSRDNFANLSAQERAAVLAFLNSL